MGRTHLRLVAAVSAVGLLAAGCGATSQNGEGPGQAGSQWQAGGATQASPVTMRAAERAVGAADARTDAHTGAAAESASPSASVPSSPTATPSPPGQPPARRPAPTPLASLTPGERALSVLALNGYAEWGGTDRKVSWIGDFERQTGCKVSLRFYVPPREGEPGGHVPPLSSFDVISAPPELAGRMIAERQAAPLNTALLTEYKKLPKRLRELPAAGGQVYGVPYLWGVNEVLYDAEKVSPGRARSIFENGAPGVRGPVMFKDSPLSLADAALALKKRGARIKNPFELTAKQLDAAAELFDELGERVYWRDPIEVVQGLASGSVRLAQGTPYHLDVLRRGGKPVRAVGDRPVTGWVDFWMVSAQAAHPSCAYRWLDWTSSAEVQRKASAWNGLAPANPAACTGGTRLICDNFRVGEPEAFKGIYFAVRPANYDQWIERWSRVTG